jgi:NAD-dependent SIR2 family protein deacetylase
MGVYWTLCTGCGHREHNPADPLCAALGADSEKIDISVDDLPHCTRCGSLLRPGVVWFDETPHHLAEIDQIVKNADLCLVIDTSSTVRLDQSYRTQVYRFNIYHLHRCAPRLDMVLISLGKVEKSLYSTSKSPKTTQMFISSFAGLAKRLYLKYYVEIMTM